MITFHFCINYLLSRIGLIYELPRNTVLDKKLKKSLKVFLNLLKTDVTYILEKPGVRCI